MANLLIAPPTIACVGLGELKSYLKIESDITDDDSFLSMLILAATAQVEAITNRKLIFQTWELTLSGFHCYGIRLPFSPVSEIVSVQYFDTNNVLQTLDSGEYTADLTSLVCSITPADGYQWPMAKNRPDAVTITFVCGHSETANDVPELLKVAVYALAAQMYQNRNTDVKLDFIYAILGDFLIINM